MSRRDEQHTELPESLGAWLDDSAQNLDVASHDGPALLPKLAEADLFRIGVPARLGGREGDITNAIAAIAAVSERSLAAGFVFWGHRTFIEYLLQSPNQGLREQLLPDLLEGHRAGATGLSNAMKFLSGIEELQITANETGGTLSLDGKLPWVTNLPSAGFDVAAAVGGVGPNPPFIVSLSSDDEGLERSPDLALMAMRATGTAAINIKKVRLVADRILHSNAGEWLPKVRPAFLGLQCGMAIGLARRSIAEAESKIKNYRDILAAPLEALAGELAGVTAQLDEGVGDGRFISRPAGLFRLRIRLADIAWQAVQIELSASGGKAYLSQPGESFQRRLREVAFIPIITPSLVQLRAALDLHDRTAIASEPA